MRRFLACFLLVVSAAPAHAGADINLLAKGSFSSADVPAIVAGRDFLIPGDGTGASKFRAARTASEALPIGVYVKVGGVRTSDAEWQAAQEWLWRQPNGEPYTQSQNNWAFGDIQRYANSWAVNVVIPHIKAALAGLEPGVVTWVMVDNVLWQDSSLFTPQRPPEYDPRTYHDATLTILLRIREFFPTLKILVNGWQGGAPAGLRGEALGSTSPNYADGIWFECWYRKCSGKAPTPERFAQDQAGLMALTQAGKVTVVDEPGLTAFTPAWREAFGIWLATTGRVGRWDNAYFNLSSPPWGDWWR